MQKEEVIMECIGLDSENRDNSVNKGAKNLSGDINPVGSKKLIKRITRTLVTVSVFLEKRLENL